MYLARDTQVENVFSRPPVHKTVSLQNVVPYQRIYPSPDSVPAPRRPSTAVFVCTCVRMFVCVLWCH